VIVFTISSVDTQILSFIQGIKSLPCNFKNACVRMCWMQIAQMLLVVLSILDMKTFSKSQSISFLIEVLLNTCWLLCFSAMCFPSLVFLSNCHVCLLIHLLNISRFKPYLYKSNKSHICFHASKTTNTTSFNLMGLNDMWFNPCLTSFLNVEFYKNSYK